MKTSERKYFKNSNASNLADYRKLRRTIKPLLLNKIFKERLQYVSNSEVA